jgi:hypothetical protein
MTTSSQLLFLVFETSGSWGSEWWRSDSDLVSVGGGMVDIGELRQGDIAQCLPLESRCEMK